MKMSKVWKKVVAGVLAAACVVSSVAAPAKKAEAAKSYTAYLMYASGDWSISNMNKNVGNTKVTKSGGTYTVTLKKSDIYKKNADKDSCQWPEGVKQAEGAMVFNVDVTDIMKKYGVKLSDSDDKKAKAGKNVKVSNVSVKVDGKPLKINAKKLNQGWIESGEGQGYNYRLEIYNEYGDTKGNPCYDFTKLKWKKSLSVSFKITYK